MKLLPVTSSLSLLSTPDTLLEVMCQRYREVYNQQAEKTYVRTVCWPFHKTTLR